MRVELVPVHAIGWGSVMAYLVQKLAFLGIPNEDASDGGRSSQSLIVTRGPGYAVHDTVMRSEYRGALHRFGLKYLHVLIVGSRGEQRRVVWLILAVKNCLLVRNYLAENNVTRRDRGENDK